MRNIGFGFTTQRIKGHEYIYVWHYKNGRRKRRCIGNERGKALSMLRRFAEEVERDALAFVHKTLQRYEKELA
jgi:hypothetical protein